MKRLRLRSVKLLCIGAGAFVMAFMLVSMSTQNFEMITRAGKVWPLECLTSYPITSAPTPQIRTIIHSSGNKTRSEKSGQLDRLVALYLSTLEHKANYRGHLPQPTPAFANFTDKVKDDNKILDFEKIFTEVSENSTKDDTPEITTPRFDSTTSLMHKDLVSGKPLYLPAENKDLESETSLNQPPDHKDLVSEKSVILQPVENTTEKTTSSIVNNTTSLLHKDLVSGKSSNLPSGVNQTEKDLLHSDKIPRFVKKLTSNSDLAGAKFKPLITERAIAASHVKRDEDVSELKFQSGVSRIVTPVSEMDKTSTEVVPKEQGQSSITLTTPTRKVNEGNTQTMVISRGSPQRFKLNVVPNVQTVQPATSNINQSIGLEQPQSITEGITQVTSQTSEQSTEQPDSVGFTKGVVRKSTVGIAQQQMQNTTGSPTARSMVTNVTTQPTSADRKYQAMRQQPTTVTNEIRTVTNSVHAQLPQCFIIGFRNCGTKALRQLLSLHPDISVTGPELDYFTMNQFRGLNWYKRQMPMSPDGRANLIVEEAPNYINSAEVLDRLLRFNSDLKLIILVRDPVSRLKAEYNTAVVNNGTTKHETRGQAKSKGASTKRVQSFEEWCGNIDRSPVVKHAVDYAGPLSAVFARFAKSQILIMSAEKVELRPVLAMQEVDKFLGVEPGFSKEDFVYDKREEAICFDTSGPKYAQVRQALTPDEVLDVESGCLGSAEGLYMKHGINKRFLRELLSTIDVYNDKLFNLLGRKFDWMTKEDI